MAVYFLRHGESKANVAKLFAGQKEDSPLTELGIEQANIAGKELAQIGTDKIISSPLVRAKETAEIVADIAGVADIDFDDRILEYDMGSLTGTPLRKVTSQELISADNAEDVIKFQARVLFLLREVKNSEQNILLVSHAGVGRIIEATRQGISPSSFYDLDPYPNAQAVRLNLEWLS